LVVACSEDATIKVWDYESGEFERTMKGAFGLLDCVMHMHSQVTPTSYKTLRLIKLVLSWVR
jgi:hypothetical protein